jgi:hypothetical protein
VKLIKWLIFLFIYMEFDFSAGSEEEPNVSKETDSDTEGIG